MSVSVEMWGGGIGLGLGLGLGELDVGIVVVAHQGLRRGKERWFVRKGSEETGRTRLSPGRIPVSSFLDYR